MHVHEDSVLDPQQIGCEICRWQVRAAIGRVDTTSSCALASISGSSAGSVAFANGVAEFERALRSRASAALGEIVSSDLWPG